MTYYQISKTLAEVLNLTLFRKGDATNGYIVTPGDLAPIGVESAVQDFGAKKLTEKEAKKVIQKINKTK